jgi:hypothetical protein
MTERELPVVVLERIAEGQGWSRSATSGCQEHTGRSTPSVSPSMAKAGSKPAN